MMIGVGTGFNVSAIALGGSLLFCAACGDGTEGEEDSAAGAGASTEEQELSPTGLDLDNDGECEGAERDERCEGADCPFDQATIDCEKSCQQIESLCAAGGPDCDTVCPDPEEWIIEAWSVEGCINACPNGDGFTCSNASHGCWMESTTCSEKLDCVKRKL